MALTRKSLQAMDIPAEKIDEIINAHTETVEAIKTERDDARKEIATLKEGMTDVETLKKNLEKANAELEKIKSADWEKKYSDLKTEYSTYKSDTEAKALRAKKESAYRKLLADAGVSQKRVDSVMKVSGTKIDAIDFDDDGNIKDADKEVASVKEEWADFIATTHEQGASVATPPANKGGDISKPSRAAQLVAQYRNEHYGNPTKED